MAAARKMASSQDKISTYNKQIDKLREINEMMRLTAAASGDWHTQQVKTISASQAFTQAMNKQNITMRQAIGHIKEYRRGTGALNEAIKEQQGLRNAMATQMTSRVFGKNATQLYVPKNVGSEMDMARTKLGMINQLLSSASANTVKWGKNTQWAGRQITVGLTVPLGIAAVGAAALALKVDEQLTRVAKVYDTVNKSGMAQETELQNLRERSLTMASRLAQDYGQKMQDVLDIEAQLAATGLAGTKLYQATSEVSRIATLGEMDYQDAVNMTVSLQTAFKLSNEQLTESFNMMNAVENATSLSIQDIAEAVPRAASALAGLGGTVSEMTVMLVAMKEAGVDAAEGANALKSATTRLLNPTPEATTFFEQTFGIDLPEEVQKANGNIYELMQTLAAMTQQFDDLDVQQGIAKLFGTYQFNRINALWQNLGQAATVGGNQTAAAMQAVGLSTEQLAAIADTEMKRWQDSIQGRFKRAVEGIKAALIPFGETVLGVITPIISAIASLLQGFNDLPGFVKGTIITILGFGAIVGPFLMLVGIFANLAGNMGRFVTGIANMRLKFKAATAEEYAAAIQAKNATSAFDSQAGAAARLSIQVAALTTAMQNYAVAQGVVMSKSGQIITPATSSSPAYTRTVGAVAGTNRLTYRAGSKSATGQPLAGHPVTDPADIAMWNAMQKSSQQIAANATVTANKMNIVKGAAKGLAVGALAVAAMASGSNTTLNNFINIAFVVASIASMGAFTPLIAGAQAVWSWMKKWIVLSVIYTANLKKAAVAQAAASGGGFVNGLKAAGGAMGSLVKIGARFLGPIGLLATGIILVKELVDHLGDAEEIQRQLISSGQAWADAIGFTFNPGQLPGQDPNDVNTLGAAAAAAAKFADENEDLADAMISAADAGGAYKMAMQQALQAVSSGATPEQARKVFEVALNVAGVKPVKIKELLLDFDKVDLSDPDSVRRQISGQLMDAFSQIKPDQMGVINTTDDWWDSLASGFRKLGGGDLSDAARAAGTQIGASLALGLVSAENEVDQANLFHDLRDEMNDQFSSAIGGFDSDTQAVLDKYGIDTADRLSEVTQNVLTRIRNDQPLTAAQEEIWGALQDDDKFQEFAGQYKEMLETIVQGMVDSKVIVQEQADAILEALGSIGDLQTEFNIPDPKPMLTLAEATQRWGEYSRNAEEHGRNLSEAEKLAALNAIRLRAGLDPASHSSQGLGTAAEAAARGVDVLANAMEDAVYTADQLANSQKSAMQGAWGDILSEADRQFQEHENAMVDAIQAAGDTQEAVIERNEELSDKAFDAREKAMKDQFDLQESNLDAEWEHRTDAATAYWDNRIKKVHDAIDAEKDADDTRQRIFEAEQRRIQRMSQRFSSNVDLGVALSTGNLDEAAKIANDISSQEAQYNAEDASEASRLASEARQEALQAELDNIENAKDAALDALQKREEAEKDALDARRQRAEESLKIERDLAQESFDSAKENNRKITEDNVRAAQAQVDADRRGLAARLRALQEFIPTNEAELRQHVADVEAAYRDYGFDLTTQGQGWAQVIGTALDSNVAAAAAALQSEIKWDIIAKNIAAQIGEGMGMTMEQVVSLLRTGVFPAGAPVTAPKYIPPNAHGQTSRAGGPTAAFHVGGKIPFTGGAASQASRTGVPLSASAYPSEVPILAKAGEYIVEKGAASKYFDLLQAINAGTLDGQINKSAVHSYHSGGMMDYTAALAALHATAAMKVAQVAATKRIQLAQQAAAAAAMGGMGAGIMGGGNAGSGVFTPGGTWPPAQMGVVSPNTAGAVAYIKSHFPQITSVGTLGSRPNYSDHPLGKAADFMVPDWNSSSGIALGDQIARFFIENPQAFGTKYVIWRKRITEGGGWEPYTHPTGASNPTLDHYDHVHTSFLHKGGLANLNSGGTINYGGNLSNLNSSRTVSPVLDSIRQGAQSGGAGSQDTFVIDLRGSAINSDVDIERAVKKVLDTRDSRRGRKRIIP